MDLKPPPLAPDGPTRALDVLDQYRAALQRIVDGETECGCAHDDEYCCALTADFHCAFCIAAQALAAPPPVAGQEPPHGNENLQSSMDQPKRSADRAGTFLANHRPPATRNEAAHDLSVHQLRRGPENAEVAALAPSQEPPDTREPYPLAWDGGRLMLNAYGRRCYDAGRQSVAALAPSPAALEALADEIETFRHTESGMSQLTAHQYNTLKRWVAALRALSPASAPPREPSHCEDGHHVWSDRFGDDWTPKIGTPCDCRAKQWGAPQ